MKNEEMMKNKKQEKSSKENGTDTAKERKQQEEPRSAKIRRQSENAWIRCSGEAVKTQKLANAKLKKEKLQHLKRRFGIRYMNMMDNGATLDELQALVENTRIEMDDVKADIERLKNDAADITVLTKEKIRENNTRDLRRQRRQKRRQSRNDEGKNQNDDEKGEDNNDNNSPTSSSETETEDEEVKTKSQVKHDLDGELEKLYVDAKVV